MDAHSFTAGTNCRIYAATMTVFYGRLLSGSPIPEMEPNDGVTPQAPRSNGRGCRVIWPATAKYEVFAITVNGDTMGVVPVDLERGVPVWIVIAGPECSPAPSS